MEESMLIHLLELGSIDEELIDDVARYIRRRGGSPSIELAFLRSASSLPREQRHAAKLKVFGDTIVRELLAGIEETHRNRHRLISITMNDQNYIDHFVITTKSRFYFQPGIVVWLVFHSYVDAVENVVNWMQFQFEEMTRWARQQSYQPESRDEIREIVESEYLEDIYLPESENQDERRIDLDHGVAFWTQPYGHFVEIDLP